jgi:4-hydroxybutyrate CoA-transferase
MARAFVRCSLSEAVGRLVPGMRVLVPPGCGEPVSLVGEICRQSDRLAGLTLMGGLHLGDYPFARAERGLLRHLAHVATAGGRAPGGRVEFAPLRYFDLVTQFARGGRWAPDCVLVHASPPDARGYLSLGVSTSVTLPAAREAPLVIAQVNPNMPRTRGNAFLHRSQIDAWVEVDEPRSYTRTPGDVERAIGRVAAWCPTGARSGGDRRHPAGRAGGALRPPRSGLHS